MAAENNIIVTGNLQVGKSVLIRKVLTLARVNHRGLFCERLYEKNIIVGYGLRRVGEHALDIFAHMGIRSDISFGAFGCDMMPFQKAAHYLEDCLTPTCDFVVIDEIGIIEKDVSVFIRSIISILDSKIPALFVVQKRALFMWDILRKRQDCLLFEVNLDNRDLLAPVLVQHVQSLVSKNKTERRSRSEC